MSRSHAKLTLCLELCCVHLQTDALRRLVFGPPCAELDTPAHIDDGSVDVRSFAIGAQPEQLAAPRNVVIGAIQNAWPCSPCDPLQQQRDAIHKRMASLVEAAGAAGVQILCLQEAWPMPFAFCTREKAPWCEFAESAGALPIVFSKQIMLHARPRCLQA